VYLFILYAVYVTKTKCYRVTHLYTTQLDMIKLVLKLFLMINVTGVSLSIRQDCLVHVLQKVHSHRNLCSCLWLFLSSIHFCLLDMTAAWPDCVLYTASIQLPSHAHVLYKGQWVQPYIAGFDGRREIIPYNSMLAYITIKHLKELEIVLCRTLVSPLRTQTTCKVP
jgi:hypothetical protein